MPEEGGLTGKGAPGLQWSAFVAFRSSVRWQHPERPLLSASGPVPRLWPLHRRLSAGRSSRRAVRLRPLPDNAWLAQGHLRRVLPPLVLRRLAGQQADLAPSGKTNAPRRNSRLPAAVLGFFLTCCVFSDSDVCRKTRQAEVELLVRRRPAGRHRLPSHDPPFCPAVSLGQ